MKFELVYEMYIGVHAGNVGSSINTTYKVNGPLLGANKLAEYLAG